MQEIHFCPFFKLRWLPQDCLLRENFDSKVTQLDWDFCHSNLKQVQKGKDADFQGWIWHPEISKPITSHLHLTALNPSDIVYFGLSTMWIESWPRVDVRLTRALSAATTGQACLEPSLLSPLRILISFSPLVGVVFLIYYQTQDSGLAHCLTSICLSLLLHLLLSCLYKI